MIVDALKLSHVPRWSIIDMLKDQTVSDHSYRATIIFLYLIKELNLQENHRFLGDMLLASLFHDVAEARTGDIPSTYKREEDKGVSVADAGAPVVHEVFKIADCIEAIIWASRYAVNKHGVIDDIRKNMLKHVKNISCRYGEKSGKKYDFNEVMTVINIIIQKGEMYA
jgi:hypothetical protein